MLYFRQSSELTVLDGTVKTAEANFYDNLTKRHNKQTNKQTASCFHSWFIKLRGIRIISVLNRPALHTDATFFIIHPQYTANSPRVLNPTRQLQYPLFYQSCCRFKLGLILTHSSLKWNCAELTYVVMNTI